MEESRLVQEIHQRFYGIALQFWKMNYCMGLTGWLAGGPETKTEQLPPDLEKKISMSKFFFSAK